MTLVYSNSDFSGLLLKQCIRILKCMTGHLVWINTYIYNLTFLKSA